MTSASSTNRMCRIVPRARSSRLPARLHIAQRDPRRRVVARLVEAAHPAIDARIVEARCELLVEQQVIDAQARVALPVVAEVVPERERLAAAQLEDRVEPALPYQPREARARRRLEQRVLLPRLRIVDVL